jgi:hypothetical protein
MRRPPQPISLHTYLPLLLPPSTLPPLPLPSSTRSQRALRCKGCCSARLDARFKHSVVWGHTPTTLTCPPLPPFAPASLNQVAADPSLRKLLFCGVGCAVQALRQVGARDGQTVEQALGLDELFVLGTHCVDNSPTPSAAKAFVSAIPGIGAILSPHPHMLSLCCCRADSSSCLCRYGTHCVDNSPTPATAKAFASTIPGVGATLSPTPHPTPSHTPQSFVLLCGQLNRR